MGRQGPQTGRTDAQPSAVRHHPPQLPAGRLLQFRGVREGHEIDAKVPSGRERME